MENLAGFETSLAETGSILVGILLRLVLVAIIAGIVTLPLFFGVLVYMTSWFWACDVTSGTRKRVLSAHFIRIAFPAFSIFATLIGLGYSGLFDWPTRIVTKLPSTKPGPTQSAITGVFDDITRKAIAPGVPALAQDVRPVWKKCPHAAKELVHLWVIETAPTTNPLDRAFPDYQVEAPPEIVMGPPPTPDAVTAHVAQMIDATRDGSIYRSSESVEVPVEVLARADMIFDTAVKDSKKKQDSAVQAMRGMALYVLVILGPIPLFVFAASFVFGRRGVVLVMRSLVRALLRTSLTYLAVFVLVFMLCCIWSVLAFIAEVTSAKDANLRAIITEKYQIPSQMKPSHLATVKSLIAELPDGQRPDNIEDNIMTWAFVGGSLDPAKRTPQNSLFFFATEPEKVTKMMPGLEDLTGEYRAMLEKAVEIMAKDKQAVVIGADKLRQLNKRVGDRMKVTSLNYKDLEFDVVIVADFPSGTRWEQSAVLNRAYLDDQLQSYPGRFGKNHPLAEKCMNLIWVRLPNQAAFDTLSTKIADPGKFSPTVKMEIESSAYSNFLSPFKTLFWFMKWPLTLGLLAITTLVTSLVIGIGVRERRTEIAVLKVLGFRPWMVLGLILGEALLIGVLSGFMATATAYSMVNAMGGIAMPIAFFNKFFVPENALWWGPLIGGITSLIGAILPSITTYRIKASQVFSRVA